jgi:hypothetical protein
MKEINKMFMFQFPNGPSIYKDDHIAIARASDRKWWQFWKPRYSIIASYIVVSSNPDDRAGVAVVD